MEPEHREPWTTEEDEAFVRHLDALGVPHPHPSPEARRLGLDRNTEEGALLAFSGSLRPDRPGHRAVAWVLLASFALPALLALLRYAGVLAEALLP